MRREFMYIPRKDLIWRELEVFDVVQSSKFCHGKDLVVIKIHAEGDLYVRTDGSEFHGGLDDPDLLVRIRISEHPNEVPADPEFAHGVVREGFSLQRCSECGWLGSSEYASFVQTTEESWIQCPHCRSDDLEEFEFWSEEKYQDAYAAGQANERARCLAGIEGMANTLNATSERLRLEGKFTDASRYCSHASAVRSFGKKAILDFEEVG